jgi:hypothetical protein
MAIALLLYIAHLLISERCLGLSHKVAMLDLVIIYEYLEIVRNSLRLFRDCSQIFRSAKRLSLLFLIFH